MNIQHDLYRWSDIRLQSEPLTVHVRTDNHFICVGTSSDFPNFGRQVCIETDESHNLRVLLYSKDNDEPRIFIIPPEGDTFEQEI